jgi:hypothetical protein
MTRIAINEALMLLQQRRALTPLSHCGNDDVQVPSTFDPADGHPTPEQLLTANELHCSHSSNF